MLYLPFENGIKLAARSGYLRRFSQDPLQQADELHRADVYSWVEPALAGAVAKIIEHDPEVAARLRLPETSRLVKIERLRETSVEPLALETCYLSAAEFSGLVRTSLGRASLCATLNRNYDLELAYADEEVDATPAEAKVADLLKVGHGAPVLRIRQVIYSTNGKPTIYALGFYRSECHTLFIRRFR